MLGARKTRFAFIIYSIYSLPTELSSCPNVGGLPILLITLFGVPIQKPTCNCCVASHHTQGYTATLEAAARGLPYKAIQFFISNIKL